MLMGNNKVKTYVCAGNVAPRRFVKFGTSDSIVTQSASAADAKLTIGVSNALGGVDTQRVEVFVDGHCPVEFAGVVNRGDYVTSDASGKAVVAAAGSGFCGISMTTTAAGDIADVKLERGVA
jgi:hypothetical protein